MRGPTSNKRVLPPGLRKIKQVIGGGQGNTHKWLESQPDIALESKFISPGIIASVTKEKGIRENALRFRSKIHSARKPTMDGTGIQVSNTRYWSDQKEPAILRNPESPGR